jgi:hypothetical protein
MQWQKNLSKIIIIGQKLNFITQKLLTCAYKLQAAEVEDGKDIPYWPTAYKSYSILAYRIQIIFHTGLQSWALPLQVALFAT